MSSNSPLKENKNDKTQTIILTKPNMNNKSKEKNKIINKENIPLPLDISFKISKLAYYNVKKKSCNSYCEFLYHTSFV